MMLSTNSGMWRLREYSSTSSVISAAHEQVGRIPVAGALGAERVVFGVHVVGDERARSAM